MARVVSATGGERLSEQTGPEVENRHTISLAQQGLRIILRLSGETQFQKKKIDQTRKAPGSGKRVPVLDHGRSEVSDQQWAEFYRFYQSTYLVRGMQGYLKESFFRGLAQSMPEQILMINARLAGKNTAAALFFKNSEKLFGRYWGSLADYQFRILKPVTIKGRSTLLPMRCDLLIQAHRGSIKYSEALSRFLRIQPLDWQRRVLTGD